MSAVRPTIVRVMLQMVVDFPSDPDSIEGDECAERLGDEIVNAAEFVPGAYPGHASILDWTTVGAAP